MAPLPPQRLHDVPRDKALEIAGGRGAVDAPHDTGHCSLPNINSVYGNRILLFNRTIEVRAGAISHGDASAAGRRERWRTTAMPSGARGPLLFAALANSSAYACTRL
ncbi:hypothetical protein ACJJTC_016166 [Scirpophaga incertulas]